MKKVNLFLVCIVFLVFTGPHFKCSEEKAISIDSLIVANQKFAFDLYNELKSEDGNLFFSPFSISAAMTMTYAGANAQTKMQMAEVLHFNPEDETIHKSFELLLDSLNLMSTEKVKIEMANGLWADENWKFLDSFFSLIENNYKAKAQNINMSDAVNTAKIINTWTKGKTQGKITNIVSPDDFDLARLVIANAIYFKGIWEYSFNEEETRKMDFILHDKSKRQVDFMYLSNSLNFFEDENVQVVELPYSEGNLSMLIILPDTRQGIRNFEKEFNYKQYETWINSLNTIKIDVFIPKFKMEYEKELSEALINMGMTDAFSRTADFSGMTGTTDLQIDKVKHKSFVEISEEGTEAAAATVVVVREKSATLKKVFKADRPFIFLIKENKRNNILFMGRMEAPNS